MTERDASLMKQDAIMMERVVKMMRQDGFMMEQDAIMMQQDGFMMERDAILIGQDDFMTEWDGIMMEQEGFMMEWLRFWMEAGVIARERPRSRPLCDRSNLLTVRFVRSFLVPFFRKKEPKNRLFERSARTDRLPRKTSL